MELSRHALKALSEYETGDSDSALMHACFALDATARKLSSKSTSGKKIYKDLVSRYIWIIEPMLGYGINLDETIWANVDIDDGKGNKIKDPLFADIIYHIFRCSHAHAEAVPKNYAPLLPISDALKWEVGGGVIRMPNTVIPALVSVSVFCEANSDVATDTQHWLSLGRDRFLVKEWWGKENEFRELLRSKYPKPTRVKLDINAIKPTSEGVIEIFVRPGNPNEASG